MKGRKAVIVIMIALVMIVSAVVATLSLNAPGIKSPEKTKIAYVSHASIYIVGNAGFLGSNASTGIIWGSGTASDPYLIEGWEINMSSINIDGIAILDSDVHFLIRNCYLHGSAGFYDGVYLYNCTNGTIDGAVCSNNYCGIESYISDGNIIVNNNFSSNRARGIYVGSSSNNTILNNNCNSNGVSGMDFWGSSSNNTILNNTCSSNNFYGIRLDQSSNNTLSNNTCRLNNDDGISLFQSNSNTLRNNTCSSNNRYGINLWDYSNSNTLRNNNCSNNNCGIYLAYAKYNDIFLNQICYNSGLGMYIDSGSYFLYGSDNHIWNNTFYHNAGAGDIYDASHIQACDMGTNNRWNSTDGYGNYWSDWTTPDSVAPFGIVDNPYSIIGLGAQDLYPLTTPTTPIPPPIPEPSILLIIPMIAVIVIIARRVRT